MSLQSYSSLGCSAVLPLHYLARIGANTGADNYFKLKIGLRVRRGNDRCCCAFNLLGGLINYANSCRRHLSSPLSSLKVLLGTLHLSWCTFLPSFSGVKLPWRGSGSFHLPRPDMSKLSEFLGRATLQVAFISFIDCSDSIDTTEYLLLKRIAPMNFLPNSFRFGNIIFAFVNHFTIVAITAPGHDDPSHASVDQQWFQFLNSTVLLWFTWLHAICGYLHFGSSIDPSKPDILNFWNNVLFLALLLSSPLLLLMSFSYPLLLWIPRDRL